MERDAEEFERWRKNFKHYLYKEYLAKDHRLDRCELSKKDIANQLDEYGKTIIKTFKKLAKEASLTNEEKQIFEEVKLFAIRTLEALNIASDIELLDRSYDIGIRKNHDYGFSNITNFGVLGLLVRLNDKVQRVKTLISTRDLEKIKNLKGGTGMHVQDEKIEDTLEDMINYATFGNMLLDGIWA